MLPFANYYISSQSISEKNITSNNIKRRKKRRPMTFYGGEGGGGDDLAVVKAAAWAWYQRKEGKPIVREFDNITRASRTPRPSRYKIEATKNMILSQNKVLAENRVSKPSLWYANYPFLVDQETQYSRLLDTYEIKDISKRLNMDDASSNNVFWQNDQDHHNYHNQDHDYDYGCDDHALLGYDSRKGDKKSYGGFMKKVSKKMLWKGMIVMGPGSTVCGRRDDVDLRASQASRRTVKVAAAAEALVRSTVSGKKSNSKSQTSRRLL